MAISIMGLIGGVVAESSVGSAIENNLKNIEIALMVMITFGVIFSGVLFVLQFFKSFEYRQYKIDKRNQEIIEKNIRKNRLRNLTTTQLVNRKTTGIKSILKVTHKDD